MSASWNLESCLRACREDRTQAWIEEYLQVPEWQNLGLLRRVRAYSVFWEPPALVPVDDFICIAGPGPEFVFPQNPEHWESSVKKIVETGPSIEDLPPLIAWRNLNGEINLADGNHRLDALKRLGQTQVWALVHAMPLRSDEEMKNGFPARLK